MAEDLHDDRHQPRRKGQLQMPRRTETPRIMSRRSALMMCAGAAVMPGMGLAQTQKGLLIRAGTPLIDLDRPARESGFWQRRTPLDQAPPETPSLPEGLAHLVHQTLQMRNANTGESIASRPVTATGFDTDALKQLTHFMRDWRHNEARAVSPNVIAGLLQIQQAARRAGYSGAIQLNSGYRTRQTNDLLRQRGLKAARNSFHLLARAADFVLPGVPVKETIAWARDLQMGGVGGYPGFVHIDDGPLRTWGTA